MKAATGKPHFEYDAAQHRYSTGGKVVPGVTRVLGFFSDKVYRAIKADVLDRASALGTEVHRCTALDDARRLDWNTLDERVVPRVAAWQIFKKQLGFVTLWSEYRWVAELDGMKYGLTCDAVGLIKGKYHAVVEKKCTRQIFPHNKLQVAGYAAGVPFKGVTNPYDRFRIARRYVVQLRETGRPDVTECDDRDDYDAFRSMLWVSYWREKHEKFYGKDEEIF